MAVQTTLLDAAASALERRRESRPPAGVQADIEVRSAAQCSNSRRQISSPVIRGSRTDLGKSNSRSVTAAMGWGTTRPAWIGANGTTAADENRSSADPARSRFLAAATACSERRPRAQLDPVRHGDLRPPVSRRRSTPRRRGRGYWGVVARCARRVQKRSIESSRSWTDNRARVDVVRRRTDLVSARAGALRQRISSRGAALQTRYPEHDHLDPIARTTGLRWTRRSLPVIGRAGRRAAVRRALASGRIRNSEVTIQITDTTVECRRA